MNHKLKIGLILENEYVNSHLKELIEWVSSQTEMEISHYLIADNVPNTQSSKIKKLFSLSLSLIHI